MLSIIVAVAIVLTAVLLWRSGESLGPGPSGASPLARLSISELLAGHSANWRVARLKEAPEVVVIEFPNLSEQGAAMNRMAALLEKAGAPRDRVLNDAELADLIRRAGDSSQNFYQGHDYSSEGLVRFYALVQSQGMKLNAQELRVRRELVDANLLQEKVGDKGVRKLSAIGAQAIITFTATQSDDPATTNADIVDDVRRESILRHEASHGRFYTDSVYRDHCRRFWREVLTEPQREHIRVYLASLGYERADEELMLNEAQAFLMHTPDGRAFNAVGVGMTEPELATLRMRFWALLPNRGTPAASAILARP